MSHEGHINTLQGASGDNADASQPTFDENRRAVGMLNEPYARQKKGTYRGGEG